MPADPMTRDEVKAAETYFGSLVDDYHAAFERKGRGLLQGTINRLFRYRTFQERTEIVKGLLARHGVSGKRVLDLGCGSGEVSLVAARLGAQVLGLDIVDGMIAIARRQAEAAGLSSTTEFRVQDITHGFDDTADVTLMVGVIEYYRDLPALLERATAATRELVIIADTRGPLWRRTLRHVLARMKHFYLYYRDPDEVARTMAAFHFVEAARIARHSFTVMAFRAEGAGR